MIIFTYRQFRLFYIQQYRLYYINHNTKYYRRSRNRRRLAVLTGGVRRARQIRQAQLQGGGARAGQGRAEQ